jgi:glycosyltransferase involved in cell wall biosynthesis
MACALPVISTRVGAIPEMVVEDETGLLIPPRDPASLRQALEALWGDPARRARMGTQGLAQARLRHDADRNAGLIFGIMEQLAQARSGVL